MATEPITIHDAPGKTIYYRLFRPIDSYVFDFDANMWKANVAACTTPELSASEVTDVGDSTYSLYTASVDLSTVNMLDTPMYVVLQAVEDLTADELRGWMGFWIMNGEMMGVATGANITQIDGSNSMAVRLGLSLEAMAAGEAIAGTLSTTQMTTDLTETTNNHYGNSTVQAVCAFATGPLKGQSRPIVAYDGATKMITVLPAFTDTIVEGNSFVILGIVV